MITSKVVQTLEKKGLAERSINAQDDRAKQLRMTSAGETLLRHAYALVQAVDAAFSGPVQAEVVNWQ